MFDTSFTNVRPSRFSVATIVVVATCLLVVTPAPWASADHIDRTRNSVMNYNIAGVTKNDGDLGIATAYLNSVLDRHPAMPIGVSRNEMCFAQHQQMREGPPRIS